MSIKGSGLWVPQPLCLLTPALHGCSADALSAGAIRDVPTMGVPSPLSLSPSVRSDLSVDISVTS